MKQSVLKGEEIFNELSEGLRAAQKKIIIVTAWFTDQELLDILTLKQKDGVPISIVISDNKQNEKLNFQEIVALGATLHKVQIKGFGMMHQKYCVIDEKIAFHGSYNWTVNARKNNSESVIKTDHKETIQDLVSDFEKINMEKEAIKIEEDISEDKKDNFLSRFFRGYKKEGANGVDINAAVSKTGELDASIDEVFKSIISAEIKKTNREEVKGMAYSQAKEVSGDAQVITKSMDSLYHLFVSDKKGNNENIEKLFKKIEDKVSEFTQNINTEKDEKLNSSVVENNSEEKNIEFQKTAINGRKSNKQVEKKHIIESTIVQKETQITSLKEKITALDIEFVKPMFKHHEFWPQLIFFIGLAIAMVLFYSSSAYIMLYSFDDALASAKLGIIPNAQVYDADALSRAMEKGGSAMLYIVIFVFIPFAIAYVAHNFNKQNDAKGIKKIISYLVVFAIDIFIALKVSATITEINFLTKGIEIERSIGTILNDINFWLVFFLGAIPFLFLAELMNMLVNFFAERSAQSGIEKMLVEKKAVKNKMETLNLEIIAAVNTSNGIGLEINNIESEVSRLEQALIFLPKELNLKVSHIKQEANNKIAIVRKKADVYKNDIENDNIQISISSLKDRVSAFIEGWNEWLHDEFAVEKAIGKSQMAMKASDHWLEDNMKKIESE